MNLLGICHPHADREDNRSARQTALIRRALRHEFADARLLEPCAFHGGAQYDRALANA